MGRERVNSTVNKRERIIWISLLLITVAISLLVISKYQTRLTISHQKVADLEGQKTIWTKSKETLTSEVSNLKAQLDKDTEIMKPFPTTEPGMAKELERRGLDGGPNQVIADLLKHTELIPFQGVLGGKMTFFKNRAFVISDKWVIAYFEDGHINGNMLLRYNVENGNITWKVIDSYLFGQ